MNKKNKDFPFPVQKSPVFYGWFIIILSTFGVLMSLPGQTAGISAFKKPLQDALKLSESDLPFCYMIGTVFSGFLLPYAGKAYDRWGVRPITVVASLGLGTTLILLSYGVEVANFLQNQTSILVFLTLCFLSLRFCGQGTLTMVSRNMLMKWFNTRRGLVNGISGIFKSVGFAGAPLFFATCIKASSWDQTWFYAGIFLITIFSVIVVLFFRDSPEACGLIPDGAVIHQKDIAKHKVIIEENWTLKQALRSYAFWPFALALCLSALYVTALTFHITTIFELANRENPYDFFLPASIFAIIFNFFCNWLSDKVEKKYINIIFLSGLTTSILGAIMLGPTGTLILTIGHGISSGTFSVISSVIWPTFYGRKHLGRISSLAMSMIVISSAVGPWLFSQSFTFVGSYNPVLFVLLIISLLLIVGSVKANKPHLATS